MLNIANSVVKISRKKVVKVEAYCKEKLKVKIHYLVLGLYPNLTLVQVMLFFTLLSLVNTHYIK
jgi:hypothetical protein